MLKRTALLATAAAMFATAAYAQPASNESDSQPVPIRGAVMFWLLDRNNDGAIDQAEVEALRTVIFDAVDSNGDGSVTKEEFVAVIDHFQDWRGERRGPRHRDGGWERHGERRDGPPPREFGERRGGSKGAEYAERHDGRGEKGHFGGPRGERMMDRLGIDTPEGLSKAEFVERAPLLFERADEDGDGKVSQSEFQAAGRNIGRLIVME
jgi:hypothetical protein